MEVGRGLNLDQLVKDSLLIIDFLTVRVEGVKLVFFPECTKTRTRIFTHCGRVGNHDRAFSCGTSFCLSTGNKIGEDLRRFNLRKFNRSQSIIVCI